MDEYSPSMVKDVNLQIQETELTPNRLYPKKSTPETSENFKQTKKILKLAREGPYYLQRTTIHMTGSFPSETTEDRRKWQNIFQVLKEKNCQPQILYLVKLSFRNEQEIKMFSNKRK